MFMICNDPRHNPLAHNNIVCPACAAIDARQELISESARQFKQITDLQGELFASQRECDRLRDTNEFLSKVPDPDEVQKLKQQVRNLREQNNRLKSKLERFKHIVKNYEHDKLRF
jgi:chemotaxis protein histidine kinase CheA